VNLISGGLAVIWIDWYAYHIARFRALAEHPELAGRTVGIELVGGTGVHQGLAFRDASRGELPITTLAPDRSWHEAGQFRLARALWGELDRFRPRAVLIPGYYTLPGIAAALWCRLRGSLPILMTESAEQDHVRSVPKEVVKRLALHVLFDRAVAGGQAHVGYLRKLGMTPDRIGHYYDTVDNQFFRTTAERLRRETAAAREGLPARYFLYAGRLAPEKNIGNLLDAFASYRAQGGDWSLVIAGDGPLGTSLRQQSATLGIAGHVQFLGFLTAAELSVPYAFASCFVLPSVREPWGLVVNEAMASGLPVLVSDRAGCAPDLVEVGGNGWLFPPKDIAALARHLLRVGELTPEALVRLGSRSVEIVARYSPENWAAEVARLTKAQLLPVRQSQPYQGAVEAQ